MRSPTDEFHCFHCELCENPSGHFVPPWLIRVALVVHRLLKLLRRLLIKQSSLAWSSRSAWLHRACGDRWVSGYCCEYLSSVLISHRLISALCCFLFKIKRAGKKTSSKTQVTAYSQVWRNLSFFRKTWYALIRLLFLKQSPFSTGHPIRVSEIKASKRKFTLGLLSNGENLKLIRSVFKCSLC